jgi:2-dehydro-3-deoxygalactonokinase
MVAQGHRSADTRLVGLDWGTSSLRAYRYDVGARVVESRELPAGLMRLADSNGPGTSSDRFERVFREACGDWVAAAPAAPIVACGMVGSAQGWRQAAYLEVPVALEQIASRLTAFETAQGVTVRIVPGLIERGVLPDVMRGEETQVVGALEAAAVPPGARVLVGLPGTHSKWVEVRNRAVEHLRTFMTGELYQTLCAHTILGRTLRQPSSPSHSAFDRGIEVTRSAEGRGGLLSTIFSARALGLTGALREEEGGDYLSGLLIGHELAGLEELRPDVFDTTSEIVLAGSAELCERYRRALAIRGCRKVVLVPAAAQLGLWRLAAWAGLVEDPAEARGDSSPVAEPR